jgi:hypothetical protein
LPDNAMPRTLESALAIGALLILSLPTQAQRNSSVGPSVDRNVTTGIGSTSGLRNVPPPGQPLVGEPFPFYFFTPPTNEVPEPPKRETESVGPGNAPAVRLAPAEPPPEDPRTMITRDRIESPQH